MEKAALQIRKQIWFMYFNEYLFQRGIITEQERNRLKVRIEQYDK